MIWGCCYNDWEWSWNCLKRWKRLKYWQHLKSSMRWDHWQCLKRWKRWNCLKALNSFEALKTRYLSWKHDIYCEIRNHDSIVYTRCISTIVLTIIRPLVNSIEVASQAHNLPKKIEKCLNMEKICFSHYFDSTWRPENRD